MRAVAFFFLMLLALGANGAHHEAHEGHGGGGTVVQVVSTMVGDKNVFVPSTIVVAAGQPHTLSIYNTTDKPHGFAIPDLGIETVLPEGVETEVPLPAVAGDRIMGIHCQLHPAHRTATLVVMAAD